MTAFEKRTLKEIPVGVKIRIVGSDLDITGQVTRNDESGLGIASSSNTKIGIPISNLIQKYKYEILT